MIQKSVLRLLEADPMLSPVRRIFCAASHPDFCGSWLARAHRHFIVFAKRTQLMGARYAHRHFIVFAKRTQFAGLASGSHPRHYLAHQLLYHLRRALSFPVSRVA
jgi:hypothetical protein